MSRPNTTDPGRVIAHRGASKSAPENTLAAFAKAFEQGTRWIEFDVSLLGDGTPVVIHDAHLDRTTNRKGPLTDLAIADLARIDAGSWFSTLYRGEPVPTLTQTMDLIDRMDLYANLEMKLHRGDPDHMADQIAEELTRRKWATKRIIVSSFEHEVLHALRARLPEQPIAALWTEPAEDWAETLTDLNAAAMHINYRALTTDLLRKARAQGVDLRVYTINRPELMESFRRLGLTSVITDHPPLYLTDKDWRMWAEE